MAQEPVTATPVARLAAYRSDHRIVLVEDRDSASGYRCATDGISVLSTLGKNWRHDPDELNNLIADAAHVTYDLFDTDCLACVRRKAEAHRVALAIERISTDFTADLDEDDQPDVDRESQPEFNGAFR